MRHPTLVPTAYLLFHQDGTERGWLSQLTCWLWVALPSRIALSLLQWIHPAADSCHHRIHLQMNSEIILASLIVVMELNKHYLEHLLGHTSVLSATGEGRKGEKNTKGLFSTLQELWVKLGRWSTCREITREQL